MTALLGCSVANGFAPCSRSCGGGWPGTRIDHDAMLAVIAHGRGDRLKCGVLVKYSRFGGMGATLVVAFTEEDAAGLDAFVAYVGEPAEDVIGRHIGILVSGQTAPVINAAIEEGEDGNCADCD